MHNTKTGKGPDEYGLKGEPQPGSLGHKPTSILWLSKVARQVADHCLDNVRTFYYIGSTGVYALSGLEARAGSTRKNNSRALQHIG